MGLSRNKVAVSEGAAGSPPFYGERTEERDCLCVVSKRDTIIDGDLEFKKLREIMLFNFQGVRLLEKIVGVTNAEGPPVPIPNTEVKLCSGENTLRATVREDSSMLTSVMGTDKTVPTTDKPSVRSTLKPNHIGS